MTPFIDPEKNISRHSFTTISYDNNKRLEFEKDDSNKQRVKQDTDEL